MLPDLSNRKAGHAHKTPSLNGGSEQTSASTEDSGRLQDKGAILMPSDQEENECAFACLLSSPFFLSYIV